MSPGPTQRAHEWGRWRGRHEVDGLDIVGFEHWCGPTYNRLTADDDGSDVVCAGCRTEIARPLNDGECEPLYRPEVIP